MTAIQNQRVVDALVRYLAEQRRSAGAEAETREGVSCSAAPNGVGPNNETQS